MLIVTDSKIAGKGVCTDTLIRKGAFLGEYEGDIITDDEATTRYAHEEKTYLFDIGEGKCIDALHRQCVLKYINHSCDPNCDDVQVGKRVFYYAKRDILPGEELTIDYELISEEEDKCFCGSPACRGTMNPPKASASGA